MAEYPDSVARHGSGDPSRGILGGPKEQRRLRRHLLGVSNDVEHPPVPDHSYTVIKVEEGTGGGIMKQVPHGPVGWIPYVLVDDLRVATDKAKSLGGKVMKDVTEVADMGWFSIIQDPTGSMLGLWKANPKMTHANHGAKERASSTGKPGAETPGPAH